MRLIKLIPGEYYHVYNRGNNKENIFLEERDWARFLFLILHLQSPMHFSQMGRIIFHYLKYKNFYFDKQQEKIKEILKNRYSSLTTFALMPNHFHLIIRENQEKGISNYMQKVQNAYTKYFNTKYEKSGHLFQGPFKAVHIKDNDQLLYLSTYIHRNPREIKKWSNKEHLYPWSSFQDYCDKNRWAKLLECDIVLDQFSSPKEYKIFVDTSPAKLKPDQLDKNLLLE